MSDSQPSVDELTIKAAVLDRLIAHLDKRKDVQNIDLMILAGFCRNCLSKWYLAEANELGMQLDMDDAHKAIYGMDYKEWKAQYQGKATEEQIAAFNNLTPEQTS